MYVHVHVLCVVGLECTIFTDYWSMVNVYFTLFYCMCTYNVHLRMLRTTANPTRFKTIQQFKAGQPTYKLHGQISNLANTLKWARRRYTATRILSYMYFMLLERAVTNGISSVPFRSTTPIPSLAHHAVRIVCSG